MLEDRSFIPGICNILVFGSTSITAMGPPNLLCNGFFVAEVVADSTYLLFFV
jgi:hypothetical protein